MIAGITIGVTVAVMLLVWAKKAQEDVNAKGGCPECGTPVPKFRRPTSFRQAFWGGWTCESCATEMDRLGNEIKQTA